ncbi:MAG: hypothetical protein H6985_13675 [Pseudomonadales bacterium]|nr:hypothetical protein [Halioglobus sp.]MCP5130620.1 hypothetical protein [Pseudomonadales bacterium]
MRRVTRLAITAILVSSTFLVTACDYRKPPATPVSGEVAHAIAEMYRRAGVSSDISGQSVLGKHFKPGEQSWDVIACVDFVLPNGDSGRDCNDSFELYQLDSGRWIVSGTVNATYLWLEVLKP